MPDFDDEGGERQGHEDEGEGEVDEGNGFRFEQDCDHGGDAKEEADGAEPLHPANEAEAQSEIVDLTFKVIATAIDPILVELADERSEMEKAVGVGEEKERDGGKKKRGRSDFDLHTQTFVRCCC